MKRVNYHLTEQLHKKLKKQSELDGIAVADLIRQALTAWYRLPRNKVITELLNPKRRRKA
jgi:hypothetical protein